MVLIWPDLDDLVYADDDVSVPLRGLWFLSKQIESLVRKASRNVSVPLRGLWFLSLERKVQHGT